MVNFLAIGPPKTGTTYLQSLLIQNPNIFLSEKKEIQFFNYHYNEGVEYYHKHFQRKKANQIVGEISPTYCDSYTTLKRIHGYAKNYFPDMKIIFIYRDPIKRLISEYYHNLRRANYDITLKEAIELELSGKKTGGKFFHIVRNSKYYEIMKEVYSLFNSENVLIISAEKELYNNDQLPITIKKIEYFLNVSEYDHYDYNVEDNSAYTPRYAAVQKILFQENKLKKILRKVIPIFGVRQKLRFMIRNLNTKTFGKEEYQSKYIVSDKDKDILNQLLKKDYEMFESQILKNI